MCCLLKLSRFDHVVTEEVFDDIVTSSNVRCKFKLLEVDEAFSLHEFQVLRRVQVLLVWSLGKVKLIVGAVVLVVVVLRDVIIEGAILIEANSSFVGPAASDILDCIASASKHK